jgi:hypothetical protein
MSIDRVVAQNLEESSLSEGAARFLALELHREDKVARTLR